MADSGIVVMRKAADRMLQLVIQFQRKVFCGSSPENENGFFPALRSFTRVYGTTDREYELLKQTEGDYLEYYSSLNEADLDADTHKEVNNYLSSILKSIHAAKAAHDIDHNIKMFQSSANDYMYQRFIVLGKEWKMFEDSYGGLLKLEDINEVHDQLIKLSSTATQRYEEQRGETESALFGQKIDKMEASTILNVYQEMLSAKKALIQAIALIKLSDANHSLFMDKPAM